MSPTRSSSYDSKINGAVSLISQTTHWYAIIRVILRFECRLILIQWYCSIAWIYRFGWRIGIDIKIWHQCVSWCPYAVYVFYRHFIDEINHSKQAQGITIIQISVTFNFNYSDTCSTVWYVLPLMLIISFEPQVRFCVYEITLLGLPRLCMKSHSFDYPDYVINTWKILHLYAHSECIYSSCCELCNSHINMLLP